MQANNLTFGVEFEVCLPLAELNFQTGTYHRGVQVPGLPIGWNSQTDASIHAPSGCIGIEIVSPVLQGLDGIRQIVAVCDWLNAKNASVNNSTGFHVHVGFDKTNEKALKRLVATVANHEQAIYASTGTKSREQGVYCASVLKSEAAKNVHKNGLPQQISRYYLLNIANLVHGKTTVEFRAFSGTTNATKALGFIRVALAFVERAMTDTCSRCFGRKLPKSVSNGQSALKRMFTFIGWDKTQPIYGALECEGVPTIKESKKTLLKLAAKYDAE